MCVNKTARLKNSSSSQAGAERRLLGCSPASASPRSFASYPSHKPIAPRIFLASTQSSVFLPRPTHYSRKVHAPNFRRSRLYVRTSGSNAAPFAARRRKARNIRTCRLSPPLTQPSYVITLLPCVPSCASVCEPVISPRIHRPRPPTRGGIRRDTTTRH